MEDSFFTSDNKLNFSLFADIVPVERDPSKFFIIHQTEYNSKLMSIFRGILNIQEISYRSLALTGAVLVCYPSNITAWYYRFKIVTTLKTPLENENKLFRKVVMISLKSYQLWNYRYLIAEYSNNPGNMGEIIEILEMDERNFHAWSYIMKIARKFKNYDECLSISRYFLDKSHKNGSAWNSRSEILKLKGFDVNEEFQFAIRRVSSSGGNESVCNYIRMLIKELKNTDVVERSLTSLFKENPFDISLMTLLLEFYEEEGDESNKRNILNKLHHVDNKRANVLEKIFIK
jgi:protein farnesyltransferase/geranylgeranyltransferase type-1 subunit alpha